MSTSGQTYKDLAIPYFKETFDCIDEVMQELRIPYYLIGATAIALEMLKQGIKPSRGTKDIDFAVMISEMIEYENIRIALLNHGFTQTAAPWTYYSNTFQVSIDILPFGEVEENHTVNFNERHTDLHVLGFREVLKDAVAVRIEEKIAHVPPLPGMVILKLIAWSDRPEYRENDLSDILRIIEHYYRLAWDEIVENHHDALDREPFDEKIIAAEVLGRNARMYLKRSKSISEKVLDTLSNNLQDAKKSAIAKDWARKLGSDIEYAYSLLASFHNGLAHPHIHIPQLVWCDAWQRIEQTRRHELEAAYRQTLYAVPSLGLILEVDKPSQKLLQLADSHAFDSWAFFTACNPRSELLTEAENNTRMQELAASLTEAGYTLHHAVGTSMDGHWSEPSFFVPGMDAATAVSIGNHWEQMAVVASLPIFVKRFQHSGLAIPR